MFYPHYVTWEVGPVLKAPPAQMSQVVACDIARCAPWAETRLTWVSGGGSDELKTWMRPCLMGKPWENLRKTIGNGGLPSGKQT